MMGKSGERYHMLDAMKGVLIIMMVIYHALYSAAYVFGYDVPIIKSAAAGVVQQIICIGFITISGMCWSISVSRGNEPIKRKLIRGLFLILCSAVITCVTLAATPNNAIHFGILNLLGICMIIMLPLRKALGKINSVVGFATSLALFVLLRGITRGYIGIGTFSLKLPEFLYADYITALLGFPPANFRSSDYFPIFPWIFIFICGCFLWRILSSSSAALTALKRRVPFFSAVGSRSILIYLLHQPVIICIFEISRLLSLALF